MVISTGRKMFTGYERAVHYLDKFSFLTEKMFGIQGAMTSYYQFYTNEVFSLTFDLQFIEKPKTEEDGFLVLLSSEPFIPDFLNPSDELDSVKGFDLKLNAVI